jgi:hypothetical protein
MDDHIPDIRAQIEAGCAVVIVGAGATIASTGSPAFSWASLLRAGAAEAAKFIPSDRKDAWDARLNQALARGDLPSFLSLGEEIEKVLRGTRELDHFLRRYFGNIAIKDRRLWEAIDQLGCRIATTHYDDVGERITSRRSIVWNERQDVIEFVKGNDTTLLHLHGFFRDRKVQACSHCKLEAQGDEADRWQRRRHRQSARPTGRPRPKAVCRALVASRHPCEKPRSSSGEAFHCEIGCCPPERFRPARQALSAASRLANARANGRDRQRRRLRLSCPASLYHADDPDQQARANKARNEVADPSA